MCTCLSVCVEEKKNTQQSSWNKKRWVLFWRRKVTLILLSSSSSSSSFISFLETPRDRPFILCLEILCDGAFLNPLSLYLLLLKYQQSVSTIHPSSVWRPLRQGSRKYVAHLLVQQNESKQAKGWVISRQPTKVHAAVKQRSGPGSKGKLLVYYEKNGN